MIRVGQRLQQERVQKGYSLEDVAKATKIRVAFLSAIEKGEYHKLPSPTYAQGFVANYVQFLGLPKRETMAIFRREFDVDKSYKVLPQGMPQTKEFPLKRLHLHQTLLAIAGIFLLVFGYLFFQYQASSKSPSLVVTTPKEGGSYAQDITVTGHADARATVVVNEEPVSLNSDGTFSKHITAFPGKVVILIKATNRFGKETTVMRTIQVKEQ